jgi:hypothetical protein
MVVVFYCCFTRLKAGSCYYTNIYSVSIVVSPAYGGLTWASDDAEKINMMLANAIRPYPLPSLKKESDDEKIAPIVMDTVRPAGRTVGM